LSSVIFEVPTRGVGRLELRDFARRLQAGVTAGREFCCLITGDNQMRDLNRRFRRKDEPTDVLSFPSGRGQTGLGEVAISWDRARAQAEEFGHAAGDELRILMLHGVLHLTGLDHDADRGEMARSELRWRKRLGLPSGLIERVRV
jgi:probable rRNA maturation factor